MSGIIAPAPCKAAPPAGVLGDTPQRDYTRKLNLFNAFAEPELRQLIEGLCLRPGMRVLDAGCGTGEALHWLLERVMPGGQIVGVDLSQAHVAAARLRAAPGISVIQGDLCDESLAPASFDLIWCVNTIHHVNDPRSALLGLKRLLRPQGRIALGQSSLLPDMYFAWDARLERLVNEAVRAYYLDRYGLTESGLTSVRALVGLLRGAELQRVIPRTLMIERVAPLNAADRAYILEAIFRNTWGERLRPYLSEKDAGELARLCDPHDPMFALDRTDFHLLQTMTMVVGEL